MEINKAGTDTKQVSLSKDELTILINSLGENNANLSQKLIVSRDKNLLDEAFKPRNSLGEAVKKVSTFEEMIEKTDFHNLCKTEQQKVLMQWFGENIKTQLDNSLIENLGI